MTWTTLGESVVLRPRGDLLEGALSDDLEGTLLELVERGRRVIICLSETRHLAARALGIIANAQSVALRKGGGLALCCARREHDFVLTATRLSPALGPYASERSAADALARAAARAEAQAI